MLDGSDGSEGYVLEAAPEGSVPPDGSVGLGEMLEGNEPGIVCEDPELPDGSTLALVEEADPGSMGVELSDGKELPLVGEPGSVDTEPEPPDGSTPKLVEEADPGSVGVLDTTPGGSPASEVADPGGLIGFDCVGYP